ncbi:hypothetical protein M2H35_16520, partial [Vibrio vulnificus]|nr:hypothetical protein [Vibrio vulnificus]
SAFSSVSIHIGVKRTRTRTKTEDAEREQTPVLYHGGKFPRTIHSHRTSRTANEVRQCLSEASMFN